MSTRDNAFDDYGIVLGNEEFALYAKRYPNIPEEDHFELCDAVGADYMGDFTGEAFIIDATGNDDYSEPISFDGDEIFYFPISKRSTIFKAAYSDMDALVAEMKEYYGRHLPEDFDYKHNIRHIVGTYYG